MKLPQSTHVKTAAEATLTTLSLSTLVLFGVYFKVLEERQVVHATTAAAYLSLPLSLDPKHLEAKAAVVYDTKTGRVLYAKNANEPLPLASLTKLMSAEAILSLKKADMRVAITEEDLAPEGDSGLMVGDVWSLKDLLTFGLVASSNDAMAAAAASAGTTSIVDRMNSTAQTLGLTKMRFSNPTGLDLDSDTAGAYGSARDMAVLVSDFLTQYPGLFGATVSPSTPIEVGGRQIEATPTAAPILDIPGLIGAKTGYTDLAGGNLVAAFDIEVGHPLVVVVLGSSHDGRFKDVRTLINAIRRQEAHN